MPYEPLKKLQRTVRKAERDLDKVANGDDEVAVGYRLRELEKALGRYLAEVRVRAMGPGQP